MRPELWGLGVALIEGTHQRHAVTLWELTAFARWPSEAGRSGFGAASAWNLPCRVTLDCVVLDAFELEGEPETLRVRAPTLPLTEERRPLALARRQRERSAGVANAVNRQRALG